MELYGSMTLTSGDAHYMEKSCTSWIGTWCLVKRCLAVNFIFAFIILCVFVFFIIVISNICVFSFCMFLQVYVAVKAVMRIKRNTIRIPQGWNFVLSFMGAVVLSNFDRGTAPFSEPSRFLRFDSRKGLNLNLFFSTETWHLNNTFLFLGIKLLLVQI